MAAGPTTKSWRPRPEIVWSAVAALAAVTIAVTGIVVARRSDSAQGSNPTTTAASGQTTLSRPSTSSPSTPGTTLAPRAGGILLGRDLPPEKTEPCRTPNVANGAAWQYGPINVGGQRYEGSYFCNVFSGGVGSLDFVLGKSYNTLRMTLGFADSSPSTAHLVMFEVIGDDQYLATRDVLKFGDVKPLVIDVSGVTRLQIKITEQGKSGGSGPPSMPTIGGPTLERAG